MKTLAKTSLFVLILACIASAQVGGGGGGASFPGTSKDLSVTPGNPASGKTKYYTKGGKICSLSPAGIESCTGGSSASACTITFTAQTSLAITKGSTCDGTSTHAYATGSLLIQIFDNATPANSVAASWTVNQSTYAIAITFLSSTSGTVVITSGGTGPQGSTGATGATGAAGASGGTITVPNDGSTGTTTNLLAKINSSGNAVKAGTGDTAVPAYLVTAGAGTTGSATLQVAGSGTCVADNTVTQGDFIVTGTSTAGRCRSAGATAPTSSWVIGIAQSSATVGTTFTLLNAPGFNAAAGGGGSTGYHTSCPPTSGSPVVVNLTNDTTVTDLMSCTLASGEFIANSLITFVASGHMATTASRPCLFFKIGTVIPSSMCLTGGTATFTDFDWEVVARCRVDSAPGASVTMYCSASGSTSNNNAWQYFDNAVNPITIATNATIVAKMQTENTNATGNITVTQLNYFAWRSN